MMKQLAGGDGSILIGVNKSLKSPFLHQLPNARFYIPNHHITNRIYDGNDKNSPSFNYTRC